MTISLKPTSFRSNEGKPALLSLPQKEAVKVLRGAIENNDDSIVLVGAHPADGRPLEAWLFNDTDVPGVRFFLRYADDDLGAAVGAERFVDMDSIEDGEEYTEAQKEEFGKALLEEISLLS